MPYFTETQENLHRVSYYKLPKELQKSRTSPYIRPKLFENSDTIPFDPHALPSVSECAAHLHLLHAISRVRREVLHSERLDEVHGLWPKTRTVHRGTQGPLQLRDSTFTTRRGEKWDLYLELAVGRFEVWVGRIDGNERLLKKRVAAAGPGAEDVTILELAVVPPLDVLMVWHSALLNPYWFYEYCKKRGLGRIRDARFPWRRIREAIDTETWKFDLPTEDSQEFHNLTTHHPDLLQQLIGPKGEPLASMMHFPRRPTVPKTKKKNKKKSPEPTEKAQPNPKTGSGSGRHPSADDRALIHLWPSAITNRSANATYLSAAVQRQLTFVHKMVEQLWIRSPVVRETLERAIDRYAHFLRLFKLQAGVTLVPTSDIDLLWHTHQCSASIYENEMRLRTGRYINHNDNVGRGVLTGGFDQTSLLFRQYFGMEYSVCLCWECEAVRVTVEKAVEGAEDVSKIDFEALGNTVAKQLIQHRAAETWRRVPQKSA